MSTSGTARSCEFFFLPQVLVYWQSKTAAKKQKNKYQKKKKKWHTPPATHTHTYWYPWFLTFKHKVLSSSLPNPNLNPILTSTFLNDHKGMRTCRPLTQRAELEMNPQLIRAAKAKSEESCADGCFQAEQLRVKGSEKRYGKDPKDWAKQPYVSLFYIIKIHKRTVRTVQCGTKADGNM